MRVPPHALSSTQRNALLCALSVGICILLTHPYLEMPVNDDFSYTKSVVDYARTGHILYNGWATTMLGWQVIWGGLAVKLFGYSFTTVRLSILPFAMGSAYLLYLILARFGANSWNATLGTLTLGLSPLFIPLAASFMSDVPALFCILLCLYLCQRAVHALSDRAAISWLCLAALSNVLDGTVRQIVWFGALVMVPCAAWLLRGRRRVVMAAAFVWPVSVLAIAAFNHWFAIQPYAVNLKLWDASATRPFHVGLAEMTVLGLTLMLFALPLLVALLESLPRISGEYRRAARGMMISVPLFLLLPAVLSSIHLFLAPWLPDVVTRFGMTHIVDVTEGPFLIPHSIRLAFTLLLLLSLAALGPWLAARPIHFLRRSEATSPDAQHFHDCFVLIVPFTLANLSLLLLRAAQLALLDRYILPLLPAVILLFILYFQQHIREKLPRSTVAILAIFAVYGIAATHDFFSAQRARLFAAGLVENAGIPRTQIHGPLEYDAWTQLQTQGYLNEKKITIPEGAYQPAPHHHAPPKECRFWFADYLTSVHPRYVIVFRPSPCFQATAFPSVPYRAWLPPFSRSVSIEKLADTYDWID